MASIIKRTLDINNTSFFPINQTVYDLMKEDADRVKRITAWKESLTTRFPSAKSEIDKIIRTLYISTYDGCLAYINAYNNENNILKEVKPATIEQVNELLKEQPTDSEAVKLLKQFAKDDQETYKAIFESWEAGVAGLIFATDSIKKFYLDYLPNTYIKDHLNKEPVITLGELDQAKLKEIMSDIFATLYSGFTSTEKQEDLNDFQKGINDNLDKLKTLITEKRETKKPIEPEKPVEKPQDPQELTNLKNELNELYDYIDGLLERQSQRPVYILTEEPEQMTRTGGKVNPNYEDFEAELKNRLLIKGKLQEKINKRKFSTPIEISKEKHPADPKPQPQPQPTPEQINKANQYDAIATIFPDGKIPENLKELWTNLNQRPNITQEELNNLKNQLQQQGIKPEELKLLLKDNWEYLKGHIDILTNIIKRAVPVSTPNLSGGSSSSNPSNSTSESKPSSSESSKPKSSESEQPEQSDKISQ